MYNGDSNLREFGKFRLDAGKKVLWFEDEPVNLPLKEIELLCVLTENAGQVVTKEEILDRIWADSFVEESNLTRHIYLLRKTLKEHGLDEDLIQTVPRRGYRFTAKLISQPAAGLVIERRTSTQTTIEIEEMEASPRGLSRGRGRSITRRAKVAGVACAVLLIGAAAFAMRSWWRSDTSAGAKIRSVAVLPVRSFTNDPEDAELRLRITDALITRLGSMSRVAVRPTSAVLPFAGSQDDRTEIGRRLRVDAIIDSFIQHEADRIRVTVQVVHVGSGEHLWSDQFDGQTDQILKLQDSISAKVARSISAADNEKLAFKKPLTNDPASYEAYLKARYFAAKRDPDSLKKAVELFVQAKDLDPNFAEAYAGLADTRHLLFNYNIDVRPEVVVEAKEDLKKALELKPDSAEALVTLGTIQMGYDWDWHSAEESFKQAIAAAPNSSIARMRYGALLVRTRRFQEAENEFVRAVELDPLSLTVNTNLGLAYFCGKNFEAADKQFGKTLELNDKVAETHWLLSRSLWQQNRKAEAVNEIQLALRLDRNEQLAEKIAAAANEGPESAVRVLLNEWSADLTRTNPHNLAYLSTYLNDAEGAIRWLNTSYEQRHPWTVWAAAAPEFELLKDDPRYRSLLQKLDLASE